MGDDNVAELRDMIAAEVPADTWDVGYYHRRQERAREALASIERWKAEDQRRRAACGLGEAERVCTAAQEAELAQRDLVQAMPATTLQDLAIKARLIREYDWHDGHVERLLDQLIAMAGLGQAVQS